MISFKYRDYDIPIELTYGIAHKKLEPLGLDITDVFSEDGESIKIILIDQRIMLKVWYYFVHEKTGDDFDEAIDYLTPEAMEKFREAFWEAVVGFTPPQLRGAMTEARLMVRRQLKSAGKNSKDTPSDSSEEQD